jgi:hypothetical protein
MFAKHTTTCLDETSRLLTDGAAKMSYRLSPMSINHPSRYSFTVAMILVLMHTNTMVSNGSSVAFSVLRGIAKRSDVKSHAMVPKISVCNQSVEGDQSNQCLAGLYQLQLQMTDEIRSEQNSGGLGIYYSMDKTL